MFGQLWTCENCGDSGMTIFVLHCPQCQRYRSEEGNTYYGKEYLPPTCQNHVLENDNLPNTSPSQRSPKTPLSSSRLASEHPLPKTLVPSLINLTRSATPEQDEQGLESPSATDGTTDLSS